jgi:CHAT domain-containing protein/tetratricopeptide (TPR) repeat protein
VGIQLNLTNDASWQVEQFRKLRLVVCSISLIFSQVAAPSQAFPQDRSNSNNPSPRADREGSVSTQGELKAGQTLGRQIKGGESNSFSLILSAGEFVSIRVEQHGNVLLATLSDSDNNELMQMDTPAGGFGPIYLSAIAATTGSYRLTVTTRDKWAIQHDYDVVITELRAATPDDSLRIEAELTFAEGRKNFRDDKVALAVPKYATVVSYWTASANHHWQALTEYALGEAYRVLGDPSKAEKYLDETLRILDARMDEDDWRLKASALNDLGNVYARTNREDKGQDKLTEALELFKVNNDRRGHASALNGLAQLKIWANDLITAGKFFEDAVRLREQENDQIGRLNALNGLAAIYDALGDPVIVRSKLAAARADWENIEIGPNDRIKYVTFLSNLANAHDKLGETSEARRYYDEALSKFGAGDPRRAATLDSKGDLLASLGELKEARSCYEEALKLLPGESLDADIKAGVLVHYAQLSNAEGNPQAALAKLEAAEQIVRSDRRHVDVLTNLGFTQALLGQSDNARENFTKALTLGEKIKDRRRLALVYQNRGETLSLIGRHAEALSDLNQAIALWEDLKDLRGQAATLNSLARLKKDRGDLAAALDMSDKALAIIESQRVAITGRELRISYLALHENYYEQNIDLKMRIGKLRSMETYSISAFEAAEKSRARVLLDSLSEAGDERIGFSSSDPNVKAMVDRRADLLGKLRSQLQLRTTILSGNRVAAQVAVIDQQIDQIISEVANIEDQIRSHNPRLAGLIERHPSTLLEVQRQLDSDSILLEYSLGDERSYVWAVTPDSIKGIQLPPRDEVESAAKRIAKAVADRKQIVEGETGVQGVRRRDQADKEFNTSSAELSEKIIRPLAPLLGTKRLVIVADGALQLVSFAALPLPGTTAEKPRRLIDDHEIVYEPSASVLALQRRELADRKRAPHAVAVIANPVFATDDPRVAALRKRNPSSSAQPKSNGQALPVIATRSADISRALEDVGLERFPRLRSSAVEAQKIVNLAPKGESKAALDFDASRETAMSSDLSEYRIVHFATHAVVNYEHPELSGIVLSLVDRRGQPQDGYLRLHDIYNLNLPADLIVLSACQTGVGKEIRGEGLIALTRGFMYAGAERVVASLWKVDDVATEELMAEFYKQIFVNGQRPAAALRTAQIALAKKRPPADWAGFVLQGEWK